MLRAGKLARYGVPALGALALAVALLGAAALGLRWTVEAKAKSWSGELRRWDEFQRRRSTVEAELNGMQGLLSRRTAVYADLQRIAPRLPAETWLEAWEAECSGSRCQYRLEGFAASEARVPEFLSALGRSGATGPLRLKATEKIKAEAVEQKTGIAANRRELVRFQLGSAP
jgi:Tfp pilus assembly protein PilN